MKKLSQKNYMDRIEFINPRTHTIKIVCEICGDLRWFPPSSHHQIKKLCKPCVNLTRRLRRLGMKIP